MADGWIPIPRIQEGGISLVSATEANKLIDAVNALMGAKIAPIANVGKMLSAGGQVIYDYTAFDSRLRAVEGAIYGPSGNNTVSLSNKVNMIVNSLNTASINATCNANTSAITVSITFPNLPI